MTAVFFLIIPTIIPTLWSKHTVLNVTISGTVFASVNKGLLYMAYLVAEFRHSSLVSGRILIVILVPVMSTLTEVGCSCIPCLHFFPRVR
jgi:hypothetical protein